MAWVKSLRSVSSSREPGRTADSGRWLGVVREVAWAASSAVLAAVRAWLGAGSTVAVPPLPGRRAAMVAVSIAAAMSAFAALTRARAVATWSWARAFAGLG